MVFSSEDLLKLRSVIEVLQDENQSRLITFHGGIVEIVVIPPSQCRNRVVARRFDQIITLEMGNSGYAKPLKTIIFDIPVARSIILELDEIISVSTTNI